MARTTTDTSTPPAQNNQPYLSFWQIWNMSFGFMGIQFGFALQNANTSRIFETLGADPKNLAIYWLAAPVTGLIVQPIIGYMSDRTWHPRWGRRRPYFAIGAVLATICLIAMPNSPGLWIAIGCLWMMDASINVSMEPFRAFVGDMLPPEQRTSGFAMQSFFIGIGAVVASSLPWFFTNVIGLADEAGSGEISQAVKWSFYIGAFAFLGAVLWTVFTTKEYPPVKKVEQPKQMKATDNKYSPSVYLMIGILFLVACIAFSSWVLIALTHLGNEERLGLLVLGGMFGFFGGCYLVASAFMYANNHTIGIVQMVRDVQLMPKTMAQLALVQFFTWFALFSLWIYATSGVTSHIYDMKLDKATLQSISSAIAERGSQAADQGKLKSSAEDIASSIFKAALSGEVEKAVISVNTAKVLLDESEALGLGEETTSHLIRVKSQYNEGADWVGILFASYSLFAALAAIILPTMARVLGRKTTHLSMLSLGGLGLLSFYFITNPNLLIVSMVGVGFAWASILSIPYAMLSSSLPSDKMGYYMGIFNFFIVIPQIVASAILGFMITTFFDGEFIYALVIGGISMIVAGLLSLVVSDQDEASVGQDVKN